MPSWTPRRPSPGLEGRIFGEPAEYPADARPAGPRLGWGWLAPVACGFILALQLTGTLTVNTETDARPETVSKTYAGLSNQTFAAFTPPWAHSARNNVHGETFESTNWTPAPSPMRTLPVFLTLTNGLIQ